MLDYDEAMFNETGYIPSDAMITEPGEEQASDHETTSRFGNKQEILEILESAPENEIEVLGRIQDILPDTIPPHNNVVELVIHHGDKDLYCVFKPFTGENKELKKKITTQQFYTQEVAAYYVSEHFGLDLVPPTVIREINGRIGALQLYIDHQDYGNWSEVHSNKIDLAPDNKEKLFSSQDFLSLAAFDFIIANPDRNPDNWLIPRDIDERLNRAEPSGIVAIDHGITLNHYDYRITYKTILGPSRLLSEENGILDEAGNELAPGAPIETPIPEDLLKRLRAASHNRTELTETLLTLGIDIDEIAYMWQRTSALIEEGIFLSKHNRKRTTVNEEDFHSILSISTPYLSVSDEVKAELNALSDSDIRLIIATPLRDAERHPRLRSLQRKTLTSVKRLALPTLHENV